MRKFLRLIGILMMGITAAVTLLGGVGTTCVALNPTNYESMKAIASLQWLYILYVLIGVALGVLGIRATIWLAKGKAGGEKSALLVLIGGVVVGGIHMATSRALRGSSMPVDGVVYITVLTLVVFLLFELPKVKGMALFEKDSPDTGDKAGGITAIVIGLLVLGVQYWAGPTHLMDGVNYADAFHQALAAVGSCAVLLGSWQIARSHLPGRTAPSFRLQR
ncbi:MAG: hypothetical protein ACK2TT_05850 [Anaerolineales bacterium]|jgi:hypothetical protein